MRPPVLWVAACIAGMAAATEGSAQQASAVLHTVITGEGYSTGGELRVHQTGAFLGGAIRWSGDSTVVNDFLLPPSTYEVDVGQDTYTLDLTEPGREPVLAIEFVTEATGRYTVHVNLLNLSVGEWLEKAGVKPAISATFRVETLDDELVIQLAPSHPLLGLAKLFPQEQADVLSALKESRSFNPGPYTIGVKDMRPPPRRPASPTDQSDGQRE